MALLEIKNLQTSFKTDAGEVKAVDGISFNLEKGKVLGIVGESGSGKSVTAYSILQILTDPGKIIGGSIKFKDQELVGISDAEMRKIRGNKISIIFQDPMTSLNPVYTIGNQLMEAILLHTKTVNEIVNEKNMVDENGVKIKVKSKKELAKDRIYELLEQVGINEPTKRFHQYPHELSGGMRQRVMIAMALACEPDILIADEPTTALDVTIQAQILELMQSLQKKLGMSIIMITHDLGVIAGMCDEVIVMYAGRVCERGTTDEIFYNPKHEYTKGLLRSIPNINSGKGDRLIPIGGTPIDMLNLPKGCPFAPRCEKCMDVCLTEKPNTRVINDDHHATCWMNDKDNIGEILEDCVNE